MKFLFDNHLSLKIAHGLDQMIAPENHVVHLRDKFEPNVEDETWVKSLAGEEDWSSSPLTFASAAIRTKYEHGRKPGTLCSF